MNLLHKDITDKILRAFYNVYNELGYGFLEKVYENALSYELSSFGLDCKVQYPILGKIHLINEKYSLIINKILNADDANWTGKKSVKSVSSAFH